MKPVHENSFGQASGGHLLADRALWHLIEEIVCRDLAVGQLRDEQKHPGTWHPHPETPFANSLSRESTTALLSEGFVIEAFGFQIG